MTDPINHPQHYNAGPIECIDAIEQVVKDYPPEVAYHVGNAMKYLWRAPHKGTTTADLQKAVWYINRAIEVRQRLPGVIASPVDTQKEDDARKIAIQLLGRLER